MDTAQENSPSLRIKFIFKNNKKKRRGRNALADDSVEDSSDIPEIRNKSQGRKKTPSHIQDGKN